MILNLNLNGSSSPTRLVDCVVQVAAHEDAEGEKDALRCLVIDKGFTSDL